MVEITDPILAEQLVLIEKVHDAAYAIMGRPFVPGAPDTFQPAYQALNELEAAVTVASDTAEVLAIRVDLVRVMRTSIRSEDEARFRFISGTTIRNSYAGLFYGIRELQYSLTGDESFR
jgi:hypothetical protein